MKLSFLILFCIITCNALCQEKKDPLFALLSEIKGAAEYKIKSIFQEQELSIDTLDDENKKNKKIKEKQRLKYFNENSECVEAYEILKIKVDKLISQLKADLTISNKKRLIKQLNNGTTTKSSWYKEIIEEIQDARNELMGCNIPGLAAIPIADITGIFTALAEVVTSARDFRAQQIKSLCEQLETSRLLSVHDLGSNSSGGSKNEEKEKS